MATIRKRNGRFHVQVRRSGHRQITKSFGKLKDAKEWARLKEIEHDRDELAPDRSLLKQIELAELIKRYLEEIAINKKGYKIDAVILKSFLRHPLCSQSLDTVCLADFIEYRDQRLKTIKSTSLKRQLAPIQNMFQIAIDEWGIPLKENPLAKLRLKATENRRERRLKEGEYQKIIEAARTRKNPWVERVIIFAIETAMRRGEILGLCWDQVDKHRGSVNIVETKNGYSRSIPLSPKAVALLHLCERDFVKGNVFPITPNALRLSWTRMLKTTDIVDLRFHDLRHEAISRLFEKGLTVPEVASISGHRDLRMLLRYAHANQEFVRNKLEN